MVTDWLPLSDNAAVVDHPAESLEPTGGCVSFVLATL
jgi:hypothetical protein